MSRMIDADALEQEGWKLHRSYQQDENTMVYETKSIQEIPTEQPERKTGKWIGYNSDDPVWRRDDETPVLLECSECQVFVLNNGEARWNYCPNCGAKMEEDDGK